MMIVFDTESDGLMHEKVEIGKEGNKIVQPPATKFHIFGWTTDGKTVHTSPDPEPFLDSLVSSDYAACHNAFTHDFPLLKRLLGFDYKGIKVDTLWLSWYLAPHRSEHGLESYSEKAGYKKTEVTDWSNPDYDLMVDRVTNDVKINWWLAVRQMEMLKELYND